MSDGDAPPIGLSDNHRRRLASALRTFLETIEEIEAALEIPPAREPLALFDGDLEEEATRRIEMLLPGIRLQVAELARMCGIEMAPQSVRRRISSSASYAWTVAEELTPAKLATSGDVDPWAAQQISARASDLARAFLRLMREADGSERQDGD